jgi:hypothetical protein
MDGGGELLDDDEEPPPQPVEVNKTIMTMTMVSIEK